MNSDGIARGQIIRDLTPVLDSDGVTGALSARVHASNNVTVHAVRQAGPPVSCPLRISVVDGDKSSCTTIEGDLRALPSLPILECGSTGGVSEGNHSLNRDPTMLTEPPVGASSTGTSASAAIGGACVRIGVEAGIRGENRDGAVRMGEGKDESKDVGVRGGIVVQGVAVALRVVICDEGISLVARHPAQVVEILQTINCSVQERNF